MHTLKQYIKKCINPELRYRVQNNILNKKDIKEIQKMQQGKVNLHIFKNKDILSYLNRCKINKYDYLFAVSCKSPTLYGSIYAYLILDLLSVNQKNKMWCEYFNNFQRTDGIFCQSELETPMFENGEHWGAHHLAAHLIIPYAKNQSKIPYEFEFLRKYKNEDNIIKMLEKLDFNHIWRSSNKIMNIGILLQYSRDFLGLDYHNTINTMEEWLMNNINRETGMWHSFPIKTKEDAYEAIRGAYHIYPLLLYDSRRIRYAEKIIDIILGTQNIWGGFSYTVKSSACADIDAIDLLIRMYSLSHYREAEVKTSLEKAYCWMLCNQGIDGGMMFSYGEEFQYGDCSHLKSKSFESNMLGTWFRLLAILYIRELLFNENWITGSVPGYELSVRTII